MHGPGDTFVIVLLFMVSRGISKKQNKTPQNKRICIMYAHKHTFCEGINNDAKSIHFECGEEKVGALILHQRLFVYLM